MHQINTAMPQSSALLDSPSRPQLEGQKIESVRTPLSKCVVALAIFVILNFACLVIEPGAYYVNCRKGLNMPEKVGMWLLRKPRPDILFMGSSRPCLGLDTDVAQAALDRCNSGKKIMNMSVVATTFDFSNVLLKNWILPHHPPKLIVYGCSEFDLYGNDIKQSRYRSIWRNMPYTHTLTRWDDWHEYTEASLDEKIEFVLDQLFPMMRDRKVFRDALVILCRLYPVPLPKHPKDYLSKPANEYTDAEITQADGNYMYYLPFYDMSRPYRADMERFVKMVQDNHIRLIFVNMPVTKRFRAYWKDPGEKKISQYRSVLADFCLQHKVPLYDWYEVPEDILDPKTSFRDTNHLSKAGSKVITEKVVTEVIMPELQRNPF